MKYNHRSSLQSNTLEYINVFNLWWQTHSSRLQTRYVLRMFSRPDTWPHSSLCISTQSPILAPYKRIFCFWYLRSYSLEFAFVPLLFCLCSHVFRFVLIYRVLAVLCWLSYNRKLTLYIIFIYRLRWCWLLFPGKPEIPMLQYRFTDCQSNSILNSQDTLFEIAGLTYLGQSSDHGNETFKQYGNTPDTDHGLLGHWLTTQ